METKIYNINNKDSAIKRATTPQRYEFLRLLQQKSNITLNNFDEDNISSYNLQKVIRIIEESKDDEQVIINFAYNYATRAI
jgi:hypothetical protein